MAYHNQNPDSFVSLISRPWSSYRGAVFEREIDAAELAVRLQRPGCCAYGAGCGALRDSICCEKGLGMTR